MKKHLILHIDDEELPRSTIREVLIDAWRTIPGHQREFVLPYAHFETISVSNERDALDHLNQVGWIETGEPSLSLVVLDRVVRLSRGSTGIQVGKTDTFVERLDEITAKQPWRLNRPVNYGQVIWYSNYVLPNGDFRETMKGTPHPENVFGKNGRLAWVDRGKLRGRDGKEFDEKSHDLSACLREKLREMWEAVENSNPRTPFRGVF